MNDFERKQKVVENWERMIKWMEKNKKEDRFYYFDEAIMFSELEENATHTHCEFCKKYLDSGKFPFDPCGKCPIALRFGTCSELNGYPGKEGVRDTWLPKAKGFLEKIKSLEVEGEPKPTPIDWNKPVRDKETGEDIIKVTDVKMVKTRSSKRFNVDLTGIGIFSGRQRVENVPEEELYKPIKLGDRIILFDREHVLVSAGPNQVLFVDPKNGFRARNPIEVKDSFFISLEEFKILVGSINWKEWYKTLKRRT